MFAVNTDGTGFTNLHNFTGGSDGANPYAGLILSGNTLYGTADYGGSSGMARCSPSTPMARVLRTCIVSGSRSTNSDGANPHAGLILSGNTLYGTANQGGSSGNGTVFAVNTNGTGFTNLHSFTALSIFTD